MQRRPSQQPHLLSVRDGTLYGDALVFAFPPFNCAGLDFNLKFSLISNTKSSMSLDRKSCVVAVFASDRKQSSSLLGILDNVM